MLEDDVPLFLGLPIDLCSFGLRRVILIGFPDGHGILWSPGLIDNSDIPVRSTKSGERDGTAYGQETDREKCRPSQRQALRSHTLRHEPGY